MNVLIVEDNPAEAALTVEAFSETGQHHELSVIPDGESAMKFLRGEDEYADAPKSDLVLLDLNLPKLHGRQVLAQIRMDANLSSTPVIIVSNSNAADDVDAAYHLHANCYLVKPPELEKFFEIIRKLVGFWTQASLPEPGKFHQLSKM